MKILKKVGNKWIVEISDEDIRIYNFGKCYLSSHGKRVGVHESK